MSVGDWLAVERRASRQGPWRAMYTSVAVRRRRQACVPTAVDEPGRDGRLSWPRPDDDVTRRVSRLTGRSSPAVVTADLYSWP